MSDTPILDVLDARIIEYRKKHPDAILRMRELWNSGDVIGFRTLRLEIVPIRDLIGIAAVSVLVHEG